MLLGAVLPLLGEAAVGAGAPGLAARAVAGEATRSAFIAMSRNNPLALPARIATREATHQIGEQLHQQQETPAPTANPALDQMLQNNDLSQYPNINRAMAEPGGQRLIQHAFGSLNGQPLNPELNNTQKAVDPKSLLTPTGGTPPIEDGVSITGPEAPEEY